MLAIKKRTEGIMPSVLFSDKIELYVVEKILDHVG